MILAAIDIGSNAARLLIKEVVKSPSGEINFVKLNLLRIPLRLGIDVFKSGKIGHVRAKMLIDTMKVFSDLMNIYEVKSYRACATSAMRDAKNGDEIREYVLETSEIHIEIISGDEEASLIYENHAEKSLKTDEALYIDVGGGSTELMLFNNSKLEYQKSFNIGTIRAINNKINPDEWSAMEEACKEIASNKKHLIAIGSGGNINKLFSMSKTKDGNPMPKDFLHDMEKIFNSMTVAERMEKFDFREDRADVILPATQIFNKVLDWTGITEVYVPKISVADGLIKSLYLNHRKKNNAAGSSTSTLK